MAEKTEFENFDAAMGNLLKVPPQIVKDAMEAEKKERAEERKAKRSASSRASTDRKD